MENENELVTCPYPCHSVGDYNELQNELVENEGYTFGMPTSVFFIIGNEFCERFSFYGMKAILAIYLVQALGLAENAATILVHSFNFFAYVFSLLGGLVADCCLGKYHTILYL